MLCLPSAGISGSPSDFIGMIHLPVLVGVGLFVRIGMALTQMFRLLLLLTWLSISLATSLKVILVSVLTMTFFGVSKPRVDSAIMSPRLLRIFA